MMDFSVLSNAVQTALGAQIPAILGAVGILVIGYLIAVLARAVVRKLLSLLKLNERLGQSLEKPLKVEQGIATAVFWFVLLVTLIGVFNTLELDQLSGPFAAMVSQVMNYLPHLLAGLVLTLVAWLAATLVRTVATRALQATQWDEKLTEQAGMAPMGDNVGQVLFWLVMLMFLPAILGVFQLEGMLDPIRNMVDQTLAMLPNIFAAGIILLAGWLVAKILRGLVVNLLGAVGADKLGTAAGMKESLELSKLVGMIVFILILIPALIAALDTLKIEAISQPATEMLGLMLAALPNIFAAVLILFITWYVASFAASLLGKLLANLGVDSLPAKMGLEHVFDDEFKLSGFVPKVMVFFAMLFATVEAAHRMDFGQVQHLVGMFIEFGAKVLLGAAILLVGFWLANLTHSAMLRASADKASAMAGIARYAILGLVLAMGLSAMGIADSIVNTAFALVFGAVAVAVALSFGLGGREAAGRQMEYWLSKLREDRQEK